MELYTLHLFAGAGGGILADLLLGHTPICAVEIEDYPRRVLLQRQLDGVLPIFPIWDDVTTFRADNPETAECFASMRAVADRLCISGGFPCQDISAAGKGEGITGARSGLWSEFSRIIGEIRPRYVFVENSPLLVSRGLDVVLSDLAKMGYDARWGVVSAYDAGQDIPRERLWILATITSKINGNRDVFRWADTKQRDMGKYITARSLVDRYLEELETKGEQREDQGKGDIPSYLCRVDNGLADELDELKAIGNGQVPQVAALAWQILTGEMT